MSMDISHADKTQAKIDPKLNSHFVGDAKVQHLYNPENPDGQLIQLVVFSAGSRTKPHIHKQGQVMYITEGRGIVATDNEKRIVTVGDVIVIPPGAWHWHGATPDTAMTHLVLQRPGNDIVWDVDMQDWETAYHE